MEVIYKNCIDGELHTVGRKANHNEEEGKRLGVFQSMVYTIQTLWHADKSFVFYTFFKNTTEEVFITFFVIYLMQYIYSCIEEERSYQGLIRMVLLFCTIHIIFHFFSAGHAYCKRLKMPKVYSYVFRKVIDKAITIELSRYEQPDFYDRFSKALDECLTKGLEGLQSLTWSIGCFLAGISALAIIAKVDPLLVLFVIPPLVAALFIGGKLNQLHLKLREEETRDKRVTEYIKRVFYEKKYAGEIRLYEIRKLLYKKHADSFENRYQISRRIYRKIGWYAFLQYAVFFGLTILSAYVYVTYVIKTSGIAKIGAYVAMISSIDYVCWRIKEVIRHMNNAGKCCIYMNNLKEFLEYESLETKAGERLVTKPLGEIEIKDICFTYQGASSGVINGLSLSIKKGEKIALVGENGAGKTTLIKLLMGLYPLQKGNITIDGIDISEFEPKQYHQHFGTVFQDLQIFALPLSHNVLMREPRNEEERILIIESLKKAQFGDVLKNLPNGIDTMISKEFDEDGFVCSGGQAQKIAIARVFAKNPDIVILDEPSSALDPIAEYQMYHNMLLASEGKTVFFISHRLSSARIADRIFYLEDGKIVESGNHEELIKKGGKYAKMFELQAKQYKETISEERLSLLEEQESAREVRGDAES
jgi:ATP-binding cassette subfamily B protein|nr:ABC transporter ATP-binding protein [uncultured Lachnoclostridium sp.]